MPQALGRGPWFRCRGSKPAPDALIIGCDIRGPGERSFIVIFEMVCPAELGKLTEVSVMDCGDGSIEYGLWVCPVLLVRREKMGADIVVLKEVYPFLSRSASI